MSLGLWHLVTGEYPPDRGGVGDYTAQLAAKLAEAGADVHVWTSGGSGVDGAGGVVVHRSHGRWTPAGLRRLDAELDRFPSPRRLLVQYAPNPWGYKGLNLGFCRWLRQRRRQGDDVRIMFHEVWYPLRLRDRPARWLLHLGQRRMARTLMDACTIAYISIPAWEPLLRASERTGRRPIVWLPVPSNIRVVEDPEGVAAVRGRLAPRGQTVIGTFGTFGGEVGGLLSRVLPSLLEGRDDRLALLLGRRGDRFAADLAEAYPDLAGRLVARGELPPSELSLHLRACDLLVQPYPDGLSSRRGSLMAGLAHGVATVSNLGAHTEPIWAESGGVALAPSADPEALAQAAERVLSCSQASGAAALAVYQRHFAVERMVKTLLGTVSTSDVGKDSVEASRRREDVPISLPG